MKRTRGNSMNKSIADVDRKVVGKLDSTVDNKVVGKPSGKPAAKPSAKPSKKSAAKPSSVLGSVQRPQIDKTIVSPDELHDSGVMIMIYSEAGVGKTTSSIKTLPKPLLVVSSEPRNPKRSWVAAGKPDGVYFRRFTEWQDLFTFCSDHTNFTEYKSILVDSHTYNLIGLLSTAIEDEGYNPSKSSSKELTARVKMSMEGYGSVSGWMRRLDTVLGNLSRDHGKIVVCTALLQENPKWDKDLVAGPLFKGQEYPRNMPQGFDLIGLVKPTIKTAELGKPKRIVTYPPTVYFDLDPDSYGEFQCKWSGVRRVSDTGELIPRIFPLDFELILQEV